MTTELGPQSEVREDKNEFIRKLEIQWAKGNFVCVGLDSDYSQVPQHLKDEQIVGDPIHEVMFKFNRMIVDATHDLVCAYKPNIAFYEAQGVSGLKALADTVSYIKRYYPDVPVIVDAKRADIGSTNKGYVEAIFDKLGADAMTIHPYLGKEALQPILDRTDKGVLILARTSNPGAGEFQDKPTWLSSEEIEELQDVTDREIGDFVKNVFGLSSREYMDSGIPMYMYVAYRVANYWNKNGNVGVVAGATYPDELSAIRRIVRDKPILIPGIGAQGGEVEATVKAGKDSRGWGMIVNSSRGIIFASKGEDFAQAARKATQALHDQINQFRV